MTRATKRWIVLGGAASVLLAAGGFVAYSVFGGDTPPPASLSTPSTSSTPTSTGEPTAKFDGTWTLDTTSGSVGDGSATFAGYRVDEELSGFGAHTAVGRTGSVEATMTIEGTSVSALEVTVDMTSLRSDDDRRDGQLVDRGIETARFPTATFTLTEPLDLGSVPKTGKAVDVTATGDLTLHGVTREVQVPVQAQWTGERIEIVGSLDVALADYDIERPVGFIVLSIADTGTIEMHLLFERA